MADNKKLRLLPHIAQQLQIMLDKKLNKLVVRVCAANKLTSAQIASIKSYWQAKSSAANNSVELIIELQPDLLAGFVMYYESTMVDASLLGRIQQWQNVSAI